MAPLKPGWDLQALVRVCFTSSAFIFVSMARPRTATSKQSKIAETYSLPSLAFISVISVTALVRGVSDLKFLFIRSSDLRASFSALVIPLGLRLGLWLKLRVPLIRPSSVLITINFNLSFLLTSDGSLRKKR